MMMLLVLRIKLNKGNRACAGGQLDRPERLHHPVHWEVEDGGGAACGGSGLVVGQRGGVVGGCRRCRATRAYMESRISIGRELLASGVL